MADKKLYEIQRLERATEFLEDLAGEIENNLIDEIGASDIAEALQQYYYFKEAYDAFDTARKRVYHAVEKLNKDVLPKKLEDSGMDLVRVPSVERSFSSLTKMSVSMSDKDAGMQWLKSHGGADLIQPTVNASSLSAFIKEKMENEFVEPPEDVFKVNTYNVISYRKYTPKD